MRIGKQRKLITVLLLLMLCLAGCKKEQTTEQTEPLNSGTPKMVITRLDMSGEIEDEELYAQAEALLQASHSLKVELESEDTCFLNFDEEITVDENSYFLLEKEGISSWKDYETKAAGIYSEEYIESNFTPLYKNVYGLYLEEDGYRLLYYGNH